jgi:hypothetical protein
MPGPAWPTRYGKQVELEVLTAGGDFQGAATVDNSDASVCADLHITGGASEKPSDLGHLS